MSASVYTPETLAERWSCSPRHVRNLIQRRELRAFRLGGKLTRIPLAAVEEYECAHLTPSADTEENAPSFTTAQDAGIATLLGPAMRLKLAASRRASGNS